jgi:hypothetical protein
MNKYTIENSNEAILEAILGSLTQMNKVMTESNQRLKDIDYKMHKLLINTNNS